MKAGARRNQSKHETPWNIRRVNPDGTVRMVDVGAKPATAREAIARGRRSPTAGSRSLTAPAR